MRGGEREGNGARDRAVAGEALVLPSRTLTALTTGALALPGLALPARADSPIEQASAGYSFSYYAEDDLEKDKFAAGTGSRERYEVFTNQFEVDLPVSRRMDAGIDFLYEKMSGASPWYVLPDTDDPTQNVQVMSGATIQETRYDLTADLDYYMEEGKDTFSAGFSKENDYVSVHGAMGMERSFAEKNTTLSLSGAYSHDWITPVQGRFSDSRQNSGEKWAVDLFAGLSQVLTRSSVAQITINYKHQGGYLSDPYKLIAIRNDVNLPDKRPNDKDQISLMARYRQHITALPEPFAASLHLDYRFYWDTWATFSHTFEAAWYQTVWFDWLTITPGIRYYSQSGAEFYKAILPGSATASVPHYRSSDFRLSPYGAISGKVKIEAALEDLLDYKASGAAETFGLSGGLDLYLAFSYERYISDVDFAMFSVGTAKEAPGLVNFQIFAVTLTGRF
ncbi:MAG: DUF3570 domain-containing protein [Myxococcota bacterium]